MLCKWAGAQEAMREHSQDGWNKPAKGIFQPMGSHAQHINCRELARKGQSQLRDELGIGQRVMSNWVVSHQFLLRVTSLSLLFITVNVIITISSITIISITIFYFVSIIRLFLSQPTIFFPDSSPHPIGMQVAVWYLVASWNQTTTKL